MRRTKIVCTIGPASDAEEIIKGLILAGMDVARLNFSHGTHEEHGQRIKKVRRLASELGRTVAIMLDTKGPEVRTGVFKGGKAYLAPGGKVLLTAGDIMGDSTHIPINYPRLSAYLRPGDTILLDDGALSLKVDECRDQEVVCTVVNGGEIRDHKGVNLPGVGLDLPALSPQDVEDIEFGLELGIDFIAASFIRQATDILEIRHLVEKRNHCAQIIAKIETPQALENLDDILRVADGLMVARGDLGVEIAVEEVPRVQKQIIAKANRAGKPVITATQMLESMISSPRPTRAEASDVYNAILDGSDALMLSGETAAGQYPVEAVRVMDRIAQRAEATLPVRDFGDEEEQGRLTVTEAISRASCTLARSLEVAAIIAPTASGTTARMVSRYRPRVPIIAVSPNQHVVRRLCLTWGVYPLLAKRRAGTDEMIEEAVEAALQAGIISQGDLTVVTAGVPVGGPGTTNLLKVHLVGEVLVRGTGIGGLSAQGTVRIVHSPQEAWEKVQEGDILVCASTDAEYLPAMRKAAAIITETGGLTSHAAIIGLELNLPVVVGVERATEKLKDGLRVTVDGARGTVYQAASKVL